MAAYGSRATFPSRCAKFRKRESDSSFTGNGVVTRTLKSWQSASKTIFKQEHRNWEQLRAEGPNFVGLRTYPAPVECAAMVAFKSNGISRVQEMLASIWSLCNSLQVHKIPASVCSLYDSPALASIKVLTCSPHSC